MSISFQDFCWDKGSRGAEGETPLHLLILIDSYQTLFIAETLLAKYPRLAVDVYEESEYKGKWLCYEESEDETATSEPLYFRNSSSKWYHIITIASFLMKLACVLDALF